MIFIIYFSLFIFSVFLFTRYRETIVVIAVLTPVLQMIKVTSNINLYDALSLLIFIRYLSLRVKHRHISSYPLLWGCLAIVFSMVCTNLFAPEGAHWPTTTILIISNLVFPYILWQLLIRNREMHLHGIFINTALRLLLLVSIYGFFELLTNSNPIIQYIVEHKDYFANYIGLSNRYRFGVRRLQSFFALNGALGMTANFGIILVAYLNKIKWGNKTFLMILFFFLVLMSLFTGTRSVYVGLFFSLIYYLMSKKVSMYNIIIMIIIVGGVFILFNQYFHNIINSFTDTQSEAGSSTEMREQQFALSYYFMSEAGLFGNGISFMSSYVRENYEEIIQGAESVWMPLMVDYGYVGVICYALCVILPMIYLFKNKNWAGLFFLFSFITTKTLTSAPGIGNYYFLTYLVFYITIQNKNIPYAPRKNDKVVSSQVHSQMLS